MRTKTNVSRKKYVRKVRARAKGFFMGRRKMYRTMVETIERAEAFATRDRKAHRRELRSLWIIRLSAVAAQHGLNYSRLINGLKKAGITLDRKQLSDLAVREPAAFTKLVEAAKTALSAAKA
jgi:large subunit ribosomal protein L20